VTTWADPTGVVTTGEFMKATVLQNALSNDLGMAWVCLARKLVTEPVTSNTTPQNDDDLFFTASAGELWNLRHIFRVSADGAVDVDIKIQFDAPTGAEICFAGAGLDGAGSFTINRWFSTATTQTFNVTTTTAVVYVVNGLLYMGGTSGTFRVKWAQGNSSATATNMMLGSCMLGAKIGANPRL